MSKLQIDTEYNAGSVKVKVQEANKEAFDTNRADPNWLCGFLVQKKIAKASQQPDDVVIEYEFGGQYPPVCQIIHGDGTKWIDKSVFLIRHSCMEERHSYSVKLPKLLIELLDTLGMKSNSEVLLSPQGKDGTKGWVAFLGITGDRYLIIYVTGNCTGMTLDAFKDALTFSANCEHTAKILRGLPDYGDYRVLGETPSEINHNTSTTMTDIIACLKSSNFVAIDIETTGLDPLVCQLTGINITTIKPNDDRTGATLETFYVPCMCDYPGVICATREELEQLFEAFKETRNIFHNASFDVTVLKHIFGEYLPIFADTMVYAQKIFCGQWKTFGLKELYNRIVIAKDGFPALSYRDVFTEDTRVYTSFEPRMVARYSGYDTYMTSKLFLKLLQWVNPRGKEYQRIVADNPYWSEVIRCLLTVEMPLLPHVIETCDIGLPIDRAQLEKLCAEYEEKKDEAYAHLQEEYRSNKRIQQWIANHPDYKAPEEFNPRSNPTVKWLFQEVFGVIADSYGKNVIGDKRKIPVSAYEISKRILNYRRLALLHKTFLQNNLDIINQPHSDGALHCNLRQTGAETGRFTCSNPNLQNIPSREKIIRSQYSARPGNVFISIDFSAQEPRILANLTRDPKLVQNYLDNRDVYCTLASGLYGIPYEQCLEFKVEKLDDKGNPIFALDENGQRISNPEGAKRRKRNKIYLLALCYGKGAASLAEDLETAAYSDWEEECKVAVERGLPKPPKPKEVTTEDAEKLMTAFLDMIPTLSDFKRQAEAESLRTGYVQTQLGHQRALPDTQLPPHQHLFIDTRAKPRVTYRSWENPSLAHQWVTNGKEFAKRYKIISTDSLISACKRKIFNTMIQGTAAGQTKLAWLAIVQDPRFKELGGRVVMQIHDEILFECPEVNVNEVVKLCKHHMETSVFSWLPDFAVPVNSDVEVMRHWNNKLAGDNLDFSLSFDDEAEEQDDSAPVSDSLDVLADVS